MLDKIEENIKRLKTAIIDLEEIKKNLSLGEPLPFVKKHKNDFEDMKNLLYSNEWPVAVDPSLICDITSENEKIERGRGIIESIVENIDNKKFLDFGCGEGYCALEAANKAELSIGYDISEFPSWNTISHPNMKLTTSFEDVKANGPYDAILMFDILDHLKEETAISALLKAKEVLKDNGILYCHVHPFTSKHATHLYSTLNKAYMHLVFTPDEIEMIIPDAKSEVNLGVKTPLKTYLSYFQKNGFQGVTGDFRKDQLEPVSNFFKRPRIAARIKANLGIQDPYFQMSIQFITYVLRKK